MTFELDPFQKEAIGWIEQEHSVFVSAPTGAGKTVIAESAIDKAHSRNERVIYTAPIKALSNQKYRDFRQRFGDDQVGILTGDVSINPDAPLLIMTTEIYRNSLFENSPRIRQVGWVIFDEIHYLDDPERGTVWEEALLFTPNTIRILALSATCPNVRQLVAWIQSIHNRPIAIVEETKRPVPLHFMYQCQGKILTTMRDLKHEGFLNRDNWKPHWKEKKRGFQQWRAKPNRIDHLLKHLQSENKLPAIYFVFGRKRAVQWAWEAAQFDFLNPHERKEIIARFDALLEKYDLTQERSAQEMRSLIQQGIAFHHAGMLPTLKEVVEQLFTSRLIKIIFTTETFALGINMPARSVAFDELTKFSGTHFGILTTRDFYQMAGRAGRRGIDKEGFVYVRVNPHDVTFHDVERVIFGKPAHIRSQLNATYATLLNLYKDLGWKLLEIYPRTFHSFQSSKKQQHDGYALIERKLKMLEQMGHLAPSKGLTAKGEFAASLFGFELLLTELHEDGVLENLNELQLAVLLSSMVFEPRKGDQPAHLSGHNEQLLKTANHYHRQIHKWETRYQVLPFTKMPYFHLAPAIEAWIKGETFDKACRTTNVDEGELVRYFRMVIQLLREVMNAPHVSSQLKKTAQIARDKINRDVVDAERQLRV